MSLRQLHALELASSFADPWLLVAVPALLVLGLVTAILRPAGAIPMLLAVPLLLATLAALTTAASFAAQILLRDRRRAELASLLLIVGWMAFSILPATLGSRHAERRAPAAAESPAAPEALGHSSGAPSQPATAAGAAERDERLARVAETIPVWALAAPSEAFALRPRRRLGRRSGPGVARDRRPGRASWRSSTASPWCSGGGSSPTPTPPPASAAPPAGRFRRYGFRGSGRRPPRSPGRRSGAPGGRFRGRLALAIPALTLLILTFVFRRPEVREHLFGLAAGGPVLVLVAIFLALVGQQAVVLNQFAVDGAGLSLEFLGPLSDRDLLRGKAAGGAILTACSLVPALLAAAVLGGGSSPWLWPAALLVCLGSYA